MFHCGHIFQHSSYPSMLKCCGENNVIVYKITKFKPPVWPFSVTGQLPSSVDQIFNRRSAPPLRTTFPEGKNLQVFTSEIWPSKLRYKFENKQFKNITISCSLLFEALTPHPSSLTPTPPPPPTTYIPLTWLLNIIFLYYQKIPVQQT